MSRSTGYKRLIGAALVLGPLAGAGGLYFDARDTDAQAESSTADQPQATPVSVATVTSRETMIWEEFSGRLEAVERVEVRPRVSGAIEAVHFREGNLVEKNERLITIDPAPYAAEVERAEAQVAAAEARLSFTKTDLDRGQQLSTSQYLSDSALDQRTNAYREAQANLRAAQAALQLARLKLDYTQVRAPVAGRVGRMEVTIGNIVGEGPTAPVLTNLVSVDPIYASFNASEQIVQTALRALGAETDAHLKIDQIPVEMQTAGHEDKPIRGHLQLIDNVVDASSGTVRMRAVFPNADGVLIPGQFARIRMGQAKSEPALLVNERAIGTDQDKKYVLVVDKENKVAYREIALGPVTDGLRVVTTGLEAGERIVVNGLQRVRPGALVAPQQVAMDGKASVQAQNAADKSDVAQR
jgi:multidrug efflux system membrane fusion protein